MPFSSKKILLLDSVDSTNNYAMGLIQKGEGKNENAVFAMEQVAGKGMRGKHWQSNKGENIILSIMVEMQWQQLFHQFQLSAAVSLACYDLVAKLASSETFVKWPNDIYINDRKAAGVLIENVVKGTF